MTDSTQFAEPPTEAPVAADVSGKEADANVVETVIAPRRAWQLIDVAELWRYRDLFLLLAWRDVSVRYKQTFLGIAWAMLRPALLMIVFTVFVAPAIGADSATTGYPAFVYCGMLLWTMFSTALSSASESVVGAERLITKVYFPRLLIPFAAAAPAVVDFAVGSLLMVGLLIAYGIVPSVTILLSPLPILAAALLAMSIGCLLAALNVVYRDVRYAIPFLIQAGLFATPAIYLPAITAPTEASTEIATPAERPQPLKSTSGLRYWATTLNPMNGFVDFFRATLTGSPLPWQSFGIGCATIAVIVPVSAIIFRRFESSFADLI
ncbi:ABC transporter permease [Stratiformator vulcanicus]|uniref:ABC-2 type transporter n=1 Tax=Stratiformator vulcanicus TaxID=2527980 RepID=A0A517QVU5_9PLAN|nr:ABC transporter permease [Stratiformator vulcanicus]QDT35775.1 ABC-2 type transporter [Stratiformator vulcanicus]